ncbi:hypothetical protein CYLTODRAFT_457607 [Cylindrobasidium torrendii FP15055 ss-10]|uniref:F-box domain-containing protein n=1 Tax=Cylindrobasidium torrendii FP15055 ss-10 TaxID=1314674 RepID=A0A0D7B044_9AGAR|nr:hypothetical protein CYLTODRAFT_457607 [Cylindrobasidium torrendii FP15055 ss-10]
MVIPSADPAQPTSPHTIGTVARMAQRLSNEYWMLIFEQLAPHDLYNVLLTNRKFYKLALRPLYRFLRFMDLSHFTQNVSFWDNRMDNMAEVPMGMALCALTRCRADAPPSYGRMRSEVWTRVTSFPNLQALEICASSIPGTFYETLHALPHLKSLSLVDNIFDTVPKDLEAVKDLKELGLTHLTLLGNVILGGRTQGRTRCHYLHLMTSPTIKVLRVDWENESSGFLSRTLAGYDGEDFNLPQELQAIELCIRINSTSPPVPHEDALQMFFSHCARQVTRLKVVGQLDVYFRLPLELLPNLEDLGGGAWATHVFLHPSRPIQYLHICDVENQGRSNYELLYRVSRMKPKLELLDIFTSQWDVEVLHAIKQLFVDLSDLRIKFLRQAPSEDVLVSVGSQFLDGFKNLRSMQLCRLRSRHLSHVRRYKWYKRHLLASSAARTEAPVQEPYSIPQSLALVKAWNRDCKALREVRLEETHVLRRASEQDTWSRRPLERPTVTWENMEMEAECLLEPREHFEWQFLDVIAETLSAADMLILTV